jgi:hypothetical protein
MRDFLRFSQDRFPGNALPVVTAALLSASLTAICMLFLLEAYSATLVHDMTAIMHNSVAETRHQDECEFAAMSNKDCAPPLVFDELPDPNEPISM